MTWRRLVLDTNVLLSALVFHAGSLEWLRHAWHSGTVRPLASRDTTTELVRVLHYPKFRLTRDEREELLDDYLPWCETIPVPSSIQVPDCRDPFDPLSWSWRWRHGPMHCSRETRIFWS